MSEVEGGQSAGSRWVGIFFDNKYLLVLTLIVSLVAGASALVNLPRLEDPVITNRNPLVLTIFPGASADRVEALVTEKIETELDDIDEIKNVSSTSRAGISVVSVELKDAVGKGDVSAISSEIRDALSDAAATFPPEVRAPVFDDKRNPVAYTLIVALRWADAEKGAESLGILSRRAEELADELRNVGGTELVRLYGAPMEEILVSVDSAALAQRGLTAAAVAEGLRRADVKVPAGQLRGKGSTLLVEVAGKLDALERVREVIVQQGDAGRTVRVGDVAVVERTWRDPPSQVAVTDGQRAVFVAARVAESERVDVWDAGAGRVLDDFRTETGNAISTEVVFRQNEYTSARLAELAVNLALGAGVVLLVILLTMGWRRSLIVSAALPLTAAVTLFVISLQGGKLNQMSIFGMIIAMGLLIDTAIVVTDEIRIYLERGMGRREAVVGALRHLFVPLLSSTLTSVLAFLPILLLPGGAGDFVGAIGGSVIVALVVSFGLSMTVIAALAGLLAEAPGKGGRTPRWLREGVEARWFVRPMGAVVELGVRRPWLGVAMGVALPVVGFVIAPMLGSQFFPRTDRDMFTVEVTLPSVSAIGETVKLTREVERVIRSEGGVERVHWLAGATFPPVYYNLVENRDNSPEYAMGVIDVDNFETTSRLVPKLQRELAEAFPQARVQVEKFAQGPPASADVEFRLRGPSVDELQRLGDAVQRRLGEQPGITNAESTLTRGEPKLWFATDEAAARAAGLDPGAVAEQLEAGLEGVAGGSLIEGVEELPVRVRVPDEGRDSVAAIADLRLVGSGGERVPLRALGKFELRPESGAITRRNGERVNNVRGFAEAGSLPIDITERVRSELAEAGFELPSGYGLELGGESENQADAVGNLLLYLPVIVTLTIATLVLSFKSVRIALILLAIAPLTTGFGLLATGAMGFPVSFNTILGCIGLVGLAFNDNIVVLAAIRANAKARAGDWEEIVKEVRGCGRHLVSTTLTTIGSFLPLLILVGGQFWPPLAIVLAGGVGGATFLAAVFTPAAYRLLVARGEDATAAA